MGLRSVDFIGYDDVVDSKLRNRFIGKDFKSEEKSYAFLSFGNHKIGSPHWELMLNVAKAPCRIAEWNDLQGLSSLAILLNAHDAGSLEVNLALENPRVAGERIQTLQNYEKNRRYLISELEREQLHLALERYNREVFSSRYDEWKLSFQIDTIGLGHNYPTYMAGLVALIEPKKRNTYIHEYHVQVQQDVAESIGTILSSFDMGVAFLSQKLSKTTTMPMILFTKHPGEILDNIPNIERLVGSFNGYIKLFGAPILIYPRLLQDSPW